MMTAYSHPDTLVTITCDKEGLKTMIQAAIAAIRHGDNWNFGDEYDTDLTPYHEMRDSLIQKYVSVYGNDDITI
tara:strand:+ start:1860 stop:2081 length:222 start_codon:yes stop_codon:yes gene_type:complete